MLASVVIDRVKEVLQDVGSMTWTEAQLIEWFNDAQRAVVSIKTDASSVTSSIDTVAGTKQSLPATGLRVLDVIRNMGADGATPGRAIKMFDRQTMDENDPLWHAATASATFKGYSFDPREPKIFYLNPPSNGTTKVEVMYLVAPTNITAASDNLGISEIYAPSMIEWILYRAFSRDSLESANGQRGEVHKNTFFNMLGVKSTVDMAVAPKIRKTQ